jgi:hypothetical protein
MEAAFSLTGGLANSGRSGDLERYGEDAGPRPEVPDDAGVDPGAGWADRSNSDIHAWVESLTRRDGLEDDQLWRTVPHKRSWSVDLAIS